MMVVGLWMIGSFLRAINSLGFGNSKAFYGHRGNQYEYTDRLHIPNFCDCIDFFYHAGDRCECEW